MDKNIADRKLKVFTMRAGRRHERVMESSRIAPLGDRARYTHGVISQVSAGRRRPSGGLSAEKFGIRAKSRRAGEPRAGLKTTHTATNERSE